MLHNEGKLRFGRRVLLAVAGVVLLSSSASADKGGNPNPGVVPPTSADYQTLSVQWNHWALEQPVTTDPATTNPLVDTTGIAAHNGQPVDGNVFFLGGLFAFNSGLVSQVERTITIPTGTRLFFPILNFEWDNVGVSPLLTVPQLRQLAAVGVTNLQSLYVTLDGVSLKDPTSYRVITPVFSYTLPPNNPPGSVNLYYFLTGGSFLVTGLQTPAVGDGYYVLLTPLTPGHHLLKFGGASAPAVDTAGDTAPFQLDVTYHINVVPGG
jgi:hypothetical protein